MGTKLLPYRDIPDKIKIEIPPSQNPNQTKIPVDTSNNIPDPYPILSPPSRTFPFPPRDTHTPKTPKFPAQLEDTPEKPQTTSILRKEPQPPRLNPMPRSR